MQPADHAAALANLYPEAAEYVAEHWALGRLEARAASRNSSQALCVSVFETIARRERKARDSLLNSLLTAAGILARDTHDAAVSAEVRQHRELLNELGGGTPTALDGLITWATGVVTVESKFTEPTFERCGQTRPAKVTPKDARFDASDPTRRLPNCSGEHRVGSDLKPSTAKLEATCRLTVQDGRRTPRRYWDVAPSLFAPTIYHVPRSPCPFASSTYQLMRNLAFAHAWAGKHGLPDWSFLVMIVDASPKAQELRRQVRAFRDTLLPNVAPRVATLSYEQAANVLAARGETDLGAWIRNRITGVFPSAEVAAAS